MLWCYKISVKGALSMMVTVRSLGLTGITGYEVSVECFSVRRTAGVRRGGPAGRGGEGVAERVWAAVKN